MNITRYLFISFLLLTVNTVLFSQTFANTVVLQQQLGRDNMFFTVRAASSEESRILWNTTGSNGSQWLVSIDGKPYDIHNQQWMPYVSQQEDAEKTLFYDDVNYSCIQELNILDDQQYATLTFSFINNSSAAVVLTPTLFLDTNIGDADENNVGNPLFITTRQLIDKETELSGEDIPSWIQLPGGPSDSILTFIFEKDLSEIPQKIVMANYFRFKSSRMEFKIDETRGFQTRHRAQVDKAILLSFAPRPVPRSSRDEIVILFGIDKDFSGNDVFPHIRALSGKRSLEPPPQSPSASRENYMDDIDALIEEADALLEGDNLIDNESVDDLENKMEELHKLMSEK